MMNKIIANGWVITNFFFRVIGIELNEIVHPTVCFFPNAANKLPLLPEFRIYLGRRLILKSPRCF